MDKTRVYGKVLNKWTATATVNGMEREVVTQLEVAYVDYYADGTIAEVGTEDFSPERYRAEVATYEARTWDGSTLNKGNQKVWNPRHTYNIRKVELKGLKLICRKKYDTNNLMMVKF